MSNKQLATIARQLATLSHDDRCRIKSASEEELPQLLQEVGVSLPSTNYWLIAIKILLYALGLILAGIGTVSCTNLL